MIGNLPCSWVLEPHWQALSPPAKKIAKWISEEQQQSNNTSKILINFIHLRKKNNNLVSINYGTSNVNDARFICDWWTLSSCIFINNKMIYLEEFDQFHSPAQEKKQLGEYEWTSHMNTWMVRSISKWLDHEPFALAQKWNCVEWL